MSLTRMASSGSARSISSAARCGLIGVDVVGKAGRDKLVPFLAIAVDLPRAISCARPRLPVGILAAVELGQHLAQEGAHVGHQPERDRIVAADLLRIDVDVDELRRRDGEGIARESTNSTCGRRSARRAPAARRPGASRGWPGSGRRARPGRAQADDWLSMAPSPLTDAATGICRRSASAQQILRGAAVAHALPDDDRPAARPRAAYRPP